MNKTENAYNYIRAWGRMMRSHHGYIENEIRKAREDKAPHDAIYYSHTDNRWHTFADIGNVATKMQVADIYADMTIGRGIKR